MRRRIASVLTLLALLAALTLPAAAVRTEESVERTIRAVGIMVGNASGDLMLDRSITRAEFVTMMTNASTYKDTVGQEGSGYSLFKDVKSSHWASEYIRLGLSKGWMIGYTDGTFRPEQTITLEESCTALLKLLGYTSESLAGSYPQAQLNKATALGLREQLAAVRGTPMTRRDCMYLFYNLLTARTSAGQYYASTLGYSVVGGEVDYTAATWDNVSGPYVAGEEDPELPFAPLTVYRDGEAVKDAKIRRYDVYYCNEDLRALWIYTERVSGKVTAIAPSVTAPTSVTMTGQTYAVGSAAAAWRLSALGGKVEGSTVTLLLGMDGSVVDVLTGEQVNTVYYGTVRSMTKTLDTEDGAVFRGELAVNCTDGTVRTYTVEKDAGYTAGQLVSVKISSGGHEITRLSEERTGGAVDRSATTMGSKRFAEGVEILDTNAQGDAVKLERERLAGKTLTTSHVRYYTEDAAGHIDRLILNDASGDLWEYGYLLSSTNTSRGTSISTQYSCMVNGKSLNFSIAGRFAVSEGGIALRYDETGQVATMRNVSTVTLTQVGAEEAMAGNRAFTVAPDVQVYIRQDKTYYPTKADDLDPEKYVITGYYDDFSSPLGNRIRMVIAREKI